jgi:hypothetical protein
MTMNYFFFFFFFFLSRVLRGSFDCKRFSLYPVSLGLASFVRFISGQFRTIHAGAATIPLLQVTARPGIRCHSGDRTGDTDIPHDPLPVMSAQVR